MTKELKVWEKVVSENAIKREKGFNYYVDSDGNVIKVDVKNEAYKEHRKIKAREKRAKISEKIEKASERKAKKVAKKQARIEKAKEMLRKAEAM